MQKLIFTCFVFCLIGSGGMAQSSWDRPMNVKKMTIQVKTDAFTATTFIEMEFYNPNEREIEGLYQFTLSPGQAITAFQLDLFGKYRDGSIEEKWKATNAYNTIVGKRIDPALLTMDGHNSYSLRIYPVPAKSTRKITMTIQQLLVLEKEKAVYYLPLNIRDTVGELDVRIDVSNSTGYPSVIRGLLQDEMFKNPGNRYELVKLGKHFKVHKPLSFSIPLSTQQHTLCVKNVNEKAFFALRLKPSIRREYTAQPKKITVFWDVSASGTRRSIPRETRFLQDYVSKNHIAQVTIISFNQKIQDTAVFFTANNFNSRWAEYLISLKYEGATQLGAIDLAKTEADAVLLFSDGKNSFGSALPNPGKAPVYCISSAAYPDPDRLKTVVGSSGGAYVDLLEVPVEDALEKISKTENILLEIQAGGTKLKIDQQLSDLKEEVLLLTGIIPANEKMLTLSYGNNGKINEDEKIPITAENTCSNSAIDRIRMLSVFDSYIQAPYWMNTLEFGKAEKVVTMNTAYIVLERVEDYVKFNITPPKELESQCDMNLFVKADELRRAQHKQMSEQQVLSMVVQTYNTRISNWAKDQLPIDLQADALRGTKLVTGSTEKNEKKPASNEKDKAREMFRDDESKEMAEVVVTALGQSRAPKELGYSVSRVSANELTQAHVVNLQNALTGKVAGLNVTTVNSGVFGDTRITLRGIRSLTGNNQPLLVLDGVPIALGLISKINPNDIREVTILRGASASAVYGPDGVNGAIIVTTKKGSRGWYSNYWGTYKLKHREDEDYLAEIKQATQREKLERYEELKKIHRDRAGFFFDMAQHLFECGFKTKAMTALYTASEVTGGEKQVLKAMAYILEGWKEFGEAIKVYQELLLVDGLDISTWRDLAWAYYQHGNYQQAVNTMHDGILKVYDLYEYYRQDMKSMMLQEMNAIIAMHGKELNLSAINPVLIRPLFLDLRIVLDCNKPTYLNKVVIKEPGGSICSENRISDNGGRVTYNYYQHYYQAYSQSQEYQIAQAKEGKYRVSLKYQEHHQNQKDIPSVIRIMTFKDMGKPGQRIHIENVMMDNQQGEVEIGEVVWKKEASHL
jgi:TonB-dependent SusC/RagA subfamily outer membrane receptor